MTATLYTRKPRPKRQNPMLSYGFKTYVCPAPLLRDFILKNLSEIKGLYTYADVLFPKDEDKGWREALSQEIAAILRQRPEAISRRLWGVMNNEGKVINAAFSEATCMAIGLDLDRDTDIPTLPGNTTQAKDLILCRAEAYAEELDDITLHRLARRTLRLSALIVNYPHKHQRLTPLAPFNCLRPYA